MKKNGKKISVIIPVLNCERFIAQAIESVINQTYQAFEIIVVDNGSTDNTASIIESYPEVKYYCENRKGTSYALNLGLSKISGDLIAFLDADDYWDNSKLEKQLNYLNQHPEIEAVFGHHQRFYDKPQIELTEYEKSDMKRILPGYFKATLLIKKDSFEKVGYFNPEITIGDFVDWYARARDMGIRMAMLSEILFHRRIHESNSSLKNKSRHIDLVKIMKASLDRRRNDQDQ